MNLKEFENNVQSQFGEDGVIAEIFSRIGEGNKVCVEFGAWDGIHLSNTWNLWKNKDWTAYLIEGDPHKHKELLENTRDFAKVNSILAYVSITGSNTLSRILENAGCPAQIDFLSIDIDGDDYYIFEGLTSLKPRVIAVEYNPTIPPSVEIVQKQGEYFGCSALSLFKLGRKKGYKLAHMTDTNMFFVIDSEFGNLNLEEQELSKYFENKHLTYVISSYDGKTFLVGPSTYSTYEKGKSTVSFPQIISDQQDIQKVIIYNA